MKSKTSFVNNRSFNLEQDPEKYLKQWCADIDEWPQSWAGDENDVIIGQVFIKELKSYLLTLIMKGRSKKTVKKHTDYLWALGGEIIGDANEGGVNPKLSGHEILLNYVSSDGGPYWRHSQSQQKNEQFDSVCRGLYKYLSP